MSAAASWTLVDKLCASYDRLVRRIETLLAERERLYSDARRMGAVILAARPAAEVLCDERDLLRLRQALREYDEWQESRREEAQP